MFTRNELELELPYSDAQRLALFKAIQTNKIEEVGSYLQQSPQLIHAKTTTAGSSLLHIAANAKRFELCEFLLKNGHETNPLDKQGKTPYQLTNIEKFKRLFVSYHSHYLYKNFYTVSQNNIPGNIKVAKPEVLSRDAFTRELLETGSGEMSYIAFGYTSIANSDAKNFRVYSKFREDILMLPYYGELLTILENEQVIQQINHLQKYSNLPVTQSKALLGANIPLHVTVAFCKLVSKGLELYPFLADSYPTESDPNPIIEFKKMFIAFGLMGFASNSYDCSPEHLPQLEVLPHYQSVVSHVKKIFSQENGALNKKIIEEMSEKYTKTPDIVPSFFL